MEAWFTKLLEISVIASWLILIILIIRVCFKKASKSFYCFLWGLVGLRLVFPFSIESIFSLIPRKEVIQPAIQSNLTTLNQTIAQNNLNEITTTQSSYSWTSLFTIIWIIGMILLFIYSLISYYRLYKKVNIRLPLNKNVYYCDSIDSPFILGIIYPKIYLPSTLDESQIKYVLQHEYAHLKRKDHLWKPIGYLLLTIYWFNPMIWIAYISLCKDIESACDEYVIQKMNNFDKKMYSETLFSCSVDRKLIMTCPLAFGEVGVKERIKAIVNYKKPSFWVLCISLVACIVLCVGFLTEPKSSVSDFIFTTGILNKEIKLNKEQKEHVLELLSNYTFDYNENNKIIYGGSFYRIHYVKDNKEYNWKITDKQTYLDINDGSKTISFTSGNTQLLNEFRKYDSFAQESIDIDPLKIHISSDTYDNSIYNEIVYNMSLSEANQEFFSVQSYIVLAYEQLGNDTNENERTKFYLLALNQGFDLSNDKPKEIEYSFSPAIFTVTNTGTAYLHEFTKIINEEIMNEFPSEIVDDAINYEIYLEQLRNEGKQKVEIHLLQEQLANKTSAVFDELYKLIKSYDNGYTDEDYMNAEGEECLHDRGIFKNDEYKEIYVRIESDPHRLNTYIVTMNNYNNGESEKIYIDEIKYVEIQDKLKEKGFEANC